MFLKHKKNIHVDDNHDEGVTEIIDRETTSPKRLDEVEPNLVETVFKYFRTEFSSLKTSEKLQHAKGYTSEPLFVLRTDAQPLTVWYRLVIKGESGNLHIPDFVGYRGSYRMSPRDKSPDLLVDCLRLPANASNVGDLRAASSAIGRAVDTLPSTFILVTNRPFTDYAKGLLEGYGITNIVLGDIAIGDTGYAFFTSVMSFDNLTRVKLHSVLSKSSRKVETYVKSFDKEHGSREASSKHSALRDTVIKLLSSRPGSSASDLATVTKKSEAVIMNELYILEKEGRANISKGHATGDIDKNEWSLTKS